MAMQNSTQGDLFQQTQDVQLAERLMQLKLPGIQGICRTSEGYVNDMRVVHHLANKVGIRNVIEFCVTTLERNSDN